MKKISVLFIIMLLFGSMLVFPEFSEKALAIGQHEASDGVAEGSVELDIPGGDKYISYYFDDYDSGGEEWAFSPENMVDGNYMTSAYTSSDGDIELLNSSNCTGIDLGTIEKVELRVYAMSILGTTHEIILRPVFSGTNDGDNHTVNIGRILAWTSWQDITADTNAPVTWSWSNITNLDCDVEANIAGGGWLYVYANRLRVTYYLGEKFNVTRTSYAQTEKNNFSFIPSKSHSGNISLKIPVSNNVRGVTDVTNNTCSSTATEVNTSDELINNTFWYDADNQFVYIRTINLTTSTIVNWTVNCSYDVTFNLIIPSYLEVGQYFHSQGFISDSDGNAISGMIAETRLLYSNGTDALDVNPKWNCTNGNYRCTFSTNTLIPGTYSVSVEFTDPVSGIKFKEGSTLYLSVDPGPGVHVSTFLHFTFYNNNTGIGLPSESFKIYASTDTTIDSTDRIYVDLFGVYTGQTIYYRVDDYFDNQIYPLTGSYQTLSVTSINQFEDIPIDWYSFSVKNMNHSIVHFKMTNGSRTYPQYLYPYEPFYWDVLAGNYTINLTYYDPIDDSIVSYTEENITITDDMYYWIRGYDLQDIILEIQITNSSLDALIINVTANVNITGSSIDVITTNIVSNLAITEANITALINSYSSNFTIIESIISHLNNTIWANFTVVESTIDTINNKLTINFDMLNVTVDYINNTIWTEFNAVNSNIDNVENTIVNIISLTESNLTSLNNLIWNSLNITDSVITYLNNTLHNEISAVNITVDYLNNNIWTNLSLINSDIDTLSVSVHTSLSASETNISNIIYNVWSALNLTNVTIDYLNATIWNELSIIQSNLNATNLTITNMILLTENNITSLIITINNILDYALMPDIEIVVFNPPMIFSVYDKEGMAIGGNIYQICPALTVIATTKVEIIGNWINSTARIPGNDTVENGTVTILRDTLYISGSGSTSYINITYTDNSTLMQNTTYIPSKINLYGQNLTIRASEDIHILRETKYNQVKKFYWSHDADTGRHTTGISVINPMNIPIYDVYVYIEFSNQSTPDPNTVVMRDVTNAGIVLKSGEHYDIGLISIHFYLLSIESDSTRGFTIEYTKRFDDAYRYGEETINIPGYVETVWNGLSFNTFSIPWINDEDTIFRGALYVKLDFDTPAGINENSIRIWDDDNNQELDESDFIADDSFIRIDASGLGDVNPGSGRSFSAYFLLSEYPGADPKELHLNTAIWTIKGFPITPFFLIFLCAAILLGGSVYLYLTKKEKNKWWKGIIIGVFIIFIFSVLTFMGI